MRVTVHSQAIIESGAVVADALVSIVGTHSQRAAVLAERFGGVLRLEFDDIPWPAPWRGGPHNELYVGPAEGQVMEAITFSRRFPGHLAIHCLQGKSRSAGIALAILAAYHQDAGRAIADLLDAAPRCHPNPGIVRHAEKLLGLDLEGPLSDASENYRWWRGQWRAEGWR
ncbi:MAG: hypothetical protein M0006_04810 [Magnetospirillum sp.]|nr:hypothetical protein [Magnetospirillum sp.]